MAMIVIRAIDNQQHQTDFKLTRKQFRALQQLVATILGAKASRTEKLYGNSNS